MQWQFNILTFFKIKRSQRSSGNHHHHPRGHIEIPIENKCFMTYILWDHQNRFALHAFVFALRCNSTIRLCIVAKDLQYHFPCVPIAFFVYKLICHPGIKLSLKLKVQPCGCALIYYLKLWYRFAHFIAKPYLLAMIS